MEAVTGIGGFFFRAQDPEALAVWYSTHLGVSPAPATYAEPSWRQQPGPTVFAPMPAESEHLGPPEHQWGINFRVCDLDAIVAQLRRSGIAVEVHPEDYPNGRFADLRDLEGNPVQLWQPSGADAVSPSECQ